MMEKQGFGSAGMNCKQLLAMVTLRLQFNMAFLGIHTVLCLIWRALLESSVCCLLKGSQFLLSSFSL